MNTVTLRIATWNLFEGGITAGEPDRLNTQIDLLADQRPDLLGLQEAAWGSDAERRLDDVADRLGMSYRTLVRSSHHDCNLAMLVRTDVIEVVGAGHDSTDAFWHAMGILHLTVEGLGDLTFVNTHLAPSSKTRRLLEAETFGLLKKHQAIAVGDFNAMSTTDTVPHAANHADGKWDSRAAKEIEAANFTDLGALAGDRTPTVGYLASDPRAYRCDRIYAANLPLERVGYTVLTGPEYENLSDHRPVVAALRLGH